MDAEADAEDTTANGFSVDEGAVDDEDGGGVLELDGATQVDEGVEDDEDDEDDEDGAIHGDGEGDHVLEGGCHCWVEGGGVQVLVGGGGEGDGVGLGCWVV